MTGPSARAPRAKARPKAARDPLPAPGQVLLAGIDAVLPRLTPSASPAPQLVDDLRAALARTAACGETCQVAAAADDVRHATTLLLAGCTEEAFQALRHARTALVGR